MSQSVTSWYCEYRRHHLVHFYPGLTVVDIKTNYVGIHMSDVPKDYDVKQGLIVGVSIHPRAIY